MSDEIDKLVDAETEAELHAPKPKGILKEDKELVNAGYMTKNAARELTEQIKATATATYVLIRRAHEYKVWVSLGYDSWADYVTEEFDMSKSRSYQLINQSKVVSAIQESVPDGTVVSITEAQARDVEKALPKITDRIKKETKDQTPEAAASTVSRVVKEARKKDDVRPNDGDAVETTSPQKDIPAKGKKSGGVAPIDADNMMRKDENDEDISQEEGFDAFDDSGSSVMAIGYIFAYVEGLGNPKDTADGVENPEESLENTDKTIAWLQSFRESLKSRLKK